MWEYADERIWGRRETGREGRDEGDGSGKRSGRGRKEGRKVGRAGKGAEEFGNRVPAPCVVAQVQKG